MNDILHPEMRGVIVATATPFDVDGQVVCAPIGRHLDACLDAGVHGFWINGCSGMGLYLSRDERLRIAEYVEQHIASRVPMWVHVGAMTTAESCELAEHAAAHGAVGVSTLPPLCYVTNLERVVEHMTAIQAASELPITYYHVPYITKLELTADQLIEMCRRVPHVAAIKYSDHNLNQANVIRQTLPHVRIMTGMEGESWPVWRWDVLTARSAPVRILLLDRLWKSTTHTWLATLAGYAIFTVSSPGSSRSRNSSILPPRHMPT